MPAPPRKLRRRLEVQGFLGLSDRDLREIGPWLRFTPTCNLLVTIGATALGSVPALVALALAMTVGIVRRTHPFDDLYNFVIRPVTGTRRLPASGGRRRIVFAVGAVWLASTAVAFAGGHVRLGYVLGFLMAAFIAPLATIQLCLLSEAMARLFGLPKAAPR
jgi:Domain of unknown function (DUF4395)